MKKIFLISIFAILANFAFTQTMVSASDRVDKSILRGLNYLASAQLPDGSYAGKNGKTTAIPSLVGMAFLSHGHTPTDEKFGPTINRCIDFVLNNVDKTTGYFGKPGNGRMYAHSITTLFLAEVSGMVDPERQKRIDAILPKSVLVLLNAQKINKHPSHKGGWRYEPTSNDSDMSCSGWALMALRSSRLNGGDVPSEAIELAVKYVLGCFNQGVGGFGYQNQQQYFKTLTGAGILCLELCGEHSHQYSFRASQYLLREYKSLSHEGYRFYGMYYTAQGLFQIGGESWKVFENWMYNYWIPKQASDGSWRGSGEEESQAYATSMMILAFSVPYRQLPIYQRDETVDEE